MISNRYPTYIARRGFHLSTPSPFVSGLGLIYKDNDFLFIVVLNNVTKTFKKQLVPRKGYSLIKLELKNLKFYKISKTEMIMLTPKLLLVRLATEQNSPEHGNILIIDLRLKKVLKQINMNILAQRTVLRRIIASSKDGNPFLLMDYFKDDWTNKPNENSMLDSRLDLIRG